MPDAASASGPDPGIAWFASPDSCGRFGEPGNPRRGRSRSGFVQDITSPVPGLSASRPLPGIFLPSAVGSSAACMMPVRSPSVRLPGVRERDSAVRQQGASRRHRGPRPGRGRPRAGRLDRRIPLLPSSSRAAVPVRPCPCRAGRRRRRAGEAELRPVTPRPEKRHAHAPGRRGRGALPATPPRGAQRPGPGRFPFPPWRGIAVAAWKGAVRGAASPALVIPPETSRSPARPRVGAVPARAPTSRALRNRDGPAAAATKAVAGPAPGIAVSSRQASSARASVRNLFVIAAGSLRISARSRRIGATTSDSIALSAAGSRTRSSRRPFETRPGFRPKSRRMPRTDRSSRARPSTGALRDAFRVPPVRPDRGRLGAAFTRLVPSAPSRSRPRPAPCEPLRQGSGPGPAAATLPGSPPRRPPGDPGPDGTCPAWQGQRHRTGDVHEPDDAGLIRRPAAASDRQRGGAVRRPGGLGLRGAARPGGAAAGAARRGRARRRLRRGGTAPERLRGALRGPEGHVRAWPPPLPGTRLRRREAVLPAGAERDRRFAEARRTSGPAGRRRRSGS